MKEYPLEIIDCSSEVSAFMSKGHHPDNEFMKACEKYAEMELDGNWTKPEKTYWKVVPVNKSQEEHLGYSSFYSESKKGVKGSFPVTVTYYP